MTRRIAVAAVPLLLAAAAVAVWHSRGSRDASVAVAQEVPATGPAAILGVDQLMQTVDDHRGPVVVKGVVSAVAAEDHALALIDAREFEECGVVNCAKLTLPVRWGGPMPSVRDIVRLKGEVKESSGKLVFVASSLEQVGSKAESSQ